MKRLSVTFILTVCFFCWGYSSVSQANPSPAASNPIYTTQSIPSNISAALYLIVSRAPFWIYLKNKTDVDHVFTELQNKFPSFQTNWVYWHAYLLHRIDAFADACQTLQSLKNKPDYLMNNLNFLSLEIMRNEATCSLPVEISDLANINNSGFEKIIFEKYLFYLIEKKQWASLNALLNIQDKNKNNTDDTKIFLKIIQGLVELDNGDRSKATKILKDVLIQNAGSFYETEIFRALEASGIKAGDFLNYQEWGKRAVNLMAAGYPMVAKDIFEKLSTHTKTDYTENIADTYFAAKIYNDSSKLYEELLRQRPLAPQKDKWKVKLAQSYARSNQFDKAIKLYEALPNQAYKLAFLYFDSGQYNKSLKLLNALKVSGNKPSDIAWLKFWSLYFTRQYQAALSLLSSLPDDNNKLLKRKKNYWQAVTWEKSGNQKKARELYQSISKTSIPDYYAYLAQHKLHENTFVPNSIVKTNYLSRPTQTIFKTDTLPNQTEKSVFDYLNSRLLGTASKESELTPEDFSDRGQNLYFNGSYNYLSALGTIFLKTHPPTFTEQAYFWTYPLAYKEWVYFYAGIYGVDPFLSLSIMKQESGYRPAISSPALALGLMQVIPQTSRDLANELKMSFFHHEDLKLAPINIQMGTYYLKKRLGEYGPNLPYIIASYNAGELAVNRWKVQGDHMMPDEFVEQIPYDETQNYVKKVLTNYWTYLLLYTK